MEEYFAKLDGRNGEELDTTAVVTGNGEIEEDFEMEI